MTTTPLRQLLGETLRQHLLRLKIKQTDLARVLEITDSAVSQILSGKLTPQHEQISVACSFLGLNAEQSYELEVMLMRIRNGERVLRSPFNQQFFAYRKAKDLEIDKLSELTGIEPIRLNLFENNCNVVPLEEEVQQLAAVFGCSLDELLISARLKTPDDSSVKPTMVCESTSEATKLQSIPLLLLEQLQGFKPNKENIFNFAARSAMHQISRVANPRIPVVAVVCAAQKINMGSQGEVILLVTDERPLGFRHIELCQDGNMTFFLRERIKDEWQIFNLFGAINLEKPGYASFSLPVLEVTLRPVKTRMIEIN